MFKTLSFLEAYQLMSDCECAVKFLRSVFGEAMMETISDAINLYAQNTDEHGCPEEADYAAILALAFNEAGFNMMKSEFDVTLGLRTLHKDD